MEYRISDSNAANRVVSVHIKNLNDLPNIHKSFEFVYLKEGSMLLKTEGRTEVMQKGDMALLLSHQVHHYETPISSDAYICIFSLDLVPKFYSDTKEKYALKNCFRAGSYYLEYIKRGVLRINEMNIYEKKAFLYTICSEFSDNCKTIPNINNYSVNVVTNIISYVSQHYTDDDLSLKKIAGVLGYEERYLSRCFHNSIKMNFRQFINEYRIGHAKELMEGNEEKMATIAFECGFRNVNSFYRAFKSITEMTPNEYIDKKNS